MTHQYTKLAEGLEQILASRPVITRADTEAITEAAALLRSAAGADVAGLLDKVREYGRLRETAGLSDAVFDRLGSRQADKDADEVAADLETSLRLALAGMGVPEGWQVVPKEPTVEMTRASALWLKNIAVMRAVDRTNAIHDAYKAMLAAAPQPKEAP